jgi:hypothetical protein
MSIFGWCHRKEAPPPPKRRPRPAPSTQRSAEPDATLAAAAPLPEVVGEGNSQSDWSAWEDSMTALDSQLHDIAPGDRVYVRDTRPSKLDDLDPFSGVVRKR